MDQMILVMYWAAGILVHVAATAAKYKVDVKTYFISRPVNTVASIFVSAGLALSFWSQGSTDFMTYFGTAYLAESLINRFEVGNAQGTNQQVTGSVGLQDIAVATGTGDGGTGVTTDGAATDRQNGGPRSSAS